MIFTKDFWRACFLRALRTFIQTIVSVWGVGMAITDLDWSDTLMMAVSATVLSILMSMLIGIPEVSDEELAGSGNYKDSADLHEIYDPDDVEDE